MTKTKKRRANTKEREAITKMKKRKADESNVNIFIDGEAKEVRKTIDVDTTKAKVIEIVEDGTDNKNNETIPDDDNNNKICQQNEEQQGVKVIEREPLNEITEVRDVHDLTMYTLKKAIERSKKYAKEQSELEHMENLLNDVN